MLAFSGVLVIGFLLAPPSDILPIQFFPWKWLVPARRSSSHSAAILYDARRHEANEAALFCLFCFEAKAGNSFFTLTISLVTSQMNSIESVCEGLFVPLGARFSKLNWLEKFFSDLLSSSPDGPHHLNHTDNAQITGWHIFTFLRFLFFWWDLCLC